MHQSMVASNELIVEVDRATPLLTANKSQKPEVIRLHVADKLAETDEV